jgi:hypothetical protein
MSENITICNNHNFSCSSICINDGCEVDIWEAVEQLQSQLEKLSEKYLASYELTLEAASNYWKKCEQVNTLTSQLDKAEKKNAILMEAVEFYSDGNNWVSPDKLAVDDYLIGQNGQVSVGGKKARKALGKIELVEGE